MDHLAVKAGCGVSGWSRRTNEMGGKQQRRSVFCLVGWVWVSMSMKTVMMLYPIHNLLKKTLKMLSSRPTVVFLCICEISRIYSFLGSVII